MWEKRKKPLNNGQYSEQKRLAGFKCLKYAMTTTNKLSAPRGFNILDI